MMIQPKPTSQNHFKFLFVFLMALIFNFQSCKSDKKDNVKETDTEMMDSTSKVKPRIIEIVTENMDFQMPDTIPSGWNTFRYKNMSPQTHFFLVDKYPAGKTSKDAQELVAPVFEKAMELISDGQTEAGFAEFANLPEWFKDVKFLGGSGLQSPKQVSDVTLKLEPGHYILECYIKMSSGMFHTSMGMVKDVYVSDENSGNEQPTADISIDISSTEGIVLNNNVSAGKHVFEVNYKDQKVYENFVGHDVNLVKVDADADMKLLENWMNWSDPKGLIEPAPAGFTFFGGVNDMPAGQKGYFTADLKPGLYVLISEVPNASAKKLMTKFEVAE